MTLTWHSLFDTVEGATAAATFVLAVGTILLACVALLTAKRTKDLAIETRDQSTRTRDVAIHMEALAVDTKELADLQRRALQAAVKPTLMPASDVEIVVGDSAVVMHARNTGSGLALLVRTRMLCFAGGDRNEEYGGTVSVAVLPPGKKASASFDLGAQRARVAQFTDRPFRIEIEYTDAVGEQPETALFHAQNVPHAGRWRVVRTEWRRGGDAKPYVSSGSGASS
jgi:hypothetical protein